MTKIYTSLPSVDITNNRLNINCDHSFFMGGEGRSLVDVGIGDRVLGVEGAIALKF